MERELNVYIFALIMLIDLVIPHYCIWFDINNDKVVPAFFPGFSHKILVLNWRWS